MGNCRILILNPFNSSFLWTKLPLCSCLISRQVSQIGTFHVCLRTLFTAPNPAADDAFRFQSFSVVSSLIMMPDIVFMFGLFLFWKGGPKIGSESSLQCHVTSEPKRVTSFLASITGCNFSSSNSCTGARFFFKTKFHCVSLRVSVRRDFGANLIKAETSF